MAELLYERHRPVRLIESGLYLLWFSVFVEGKENGMKFRNAKAWAAAIEYEWHKLRGEKIPQKEIANLHGISVSTLSKYVNQVASLLQ